MVVFLFSSLIYLEYSGILPHYSLLGSDLHANEFLIIAICLVLSASRHPDGAAMLAMDRSLTVSESFIKWRRRFKTAGTPPALWISAISYAPAGIMAQR